METPDKSDDSLEQEPNQREAVRYPNATEFLINCTNRLDSMLNRVTKPVVLPVLPRTPAGTSVRAQFTKRTPNYPKKPSPPPLDLDERPDFQKNRTQFRRVVNLPLFGKKVEQMRKKSRVLSADMDSPQASKLELTLQMPIKEDSRSASSEDLDNTQESGDYTTKSKDTSERPNSRSKLTIYSHNISVRPPGLRSLSASNNSLTPAEKPVLLGSPRFEEPVSRLFIKEQAKTIMRPKASLDHSDFGLVNLRSSSAIKKEISARRKEIIERQRRLLSCQPMIKETPDSELTSQFNFSPHLRSSPDSQTSHRGFSNALVSARTRRSVIPSRGSSMNTADAELRIEAKPFESVPPSSPTTKKRPPEKLTFEAHAHLLLEAQCPPKLEYSDPMEYLQALNKLRFEYNKATQSEFIKHYWRVQPEYKSRRDELGGTISASQWGNYMNQLDRTLQVNKQRTKNRRQRRKPKPIKTQPLSLYKQVFLDKTLSPLQSPNAEPHRDVYSPSRRNRTLDL